jgi:hypothetical protein
LSNQQFELEEEIEDTMPSVPICGSNLSTPVVDKAYYINEIHYTVGGRIYIENAD